MIVVYIDTQNVHKSIEDLGRILDRELFFVYLQEKFAPSTIKMFVWYIPQMNHFYKKMEQIWYTLIFKETALRNDWSIKWNIDIDLTMHVMEDLLIGWLSLWYIVSGDGDYNTLIQRLRQDNILWRLLVPNIAKTTAQLRKSAGSNIQSLHELQHRLSKKEPSGKG